MIRAAMAAACLTIWATSASQAFALPEFPDDVQDATGAPCPPHCTLCHADEGAGEENLTRPFGKAFLAAGGEDGVARAIARLKARGTDSDGDGAADIDELALGNDPNNSYDSRICGPEAGCSVTAAPAEGTRGAGLASLCATVLGLLVVRRARKPRA